MRPEPNFTSVKLTDHSVDLEWQTELGGEVARTSLSSDKAPSPEFAKALADFKPEVLKLLALPKAWGEDLQVRSVAIKFKPDGERKGITVSLTKPIADSNAPLNLSTPFLPAPSEDGSFGMSSRMVACVEELEAHARTFVEGRRAQVELFTGPALASEEEAA